MLLPLLGPVAIAVEPEGAELLGAVGAKRESKALKSRRSSSPASCIRAARVLAGSTWSPALGTLRKDSERLLDRSGGSDQSQNSTHGLQETLLDQSLKMIPDIIGMGGTTEMKPQLEVGELGGIGQVRAGDEQLMIGHHRLDMTDSFLSFKR